jgi:hypothetical protein
MLLARARRARALVLLCLAALPASHAGAIGRQAKRHRPGRPSVAEASLELLTRAAEMLSLYTPPFVYHMDRPGDRAELIRTLWTGDYESAAGRFTECNPELVSFFENQCLDDTETPVRFRDAQSGTSWPRFEGVISALFRARSLRAVPLETAALSVSFLHQRVPHMAWSLMVHFTKAVMSWSSRGRGLMNSVRKLWSMTLAARTRQHRG